MSSEASVSLSAHRGSAFEGGLPLEIRKAGGTHPTGMLSRSFFCNFVHELFILPSVISQLPRFTYSQNFAL